MGIAPSRWLIGGLVGLLSAACCTCLREPAQPPLQEDARASVVTPSSTPAVDLSPGVVIFLANPSNPIEVHAAEYLRCELSRRFGISVVCDSRADHALDGRVHVALGGPDPSGMPAPGVDGYVLHVFGDTRRVVFAGGGGNGVIRGAFALAQLVSMQTGGPTWPTTSVSDTPEMTIRMTREILSDQHPPAGMSREELDRCQLDWWARWGLNYTLLPGRLSKPLAGQEDALKWYLRESHERGMKVGVNLGGRSLCASDDREMATYLLQARRHLESGCDFAVVLFDDLPSPRTGGHCDRCIKRFGGSLAREQRYILERLQETLREFGPDRQLIWCPTYYSLGMTGYRNAVEGPEAYFSILGDSPEVRRAWMYHCAFDGAFMAYLDSKGLTRRIWWYNGIRTQYYMVSRDFDGYASWGERLVIPGLKDFESFFSPFENGWLMPGFASEDPALHRCVSPLVPASRDARERTVIPSKSWTELREISRRMDGAYFCGATTPYHVGMIGLFAAHPQGFDPDEAAKTVMTAMFGSPGQEIAMRWEEAYADVQLILARAQGRALSGESLQDVEQETAAMADLEVQLRNCVRTEPSALPRAVLDPLIDEMTQWRQRARLLATAEPKK